MPDGTTVHHRRQEARERARIRGRRATARSQCRIAGFRAGRRFGAGHRYTADGPDPRSGTHHTSRAIRRGAWPKLGGRGRGLGGLRRRGFNASRAYEKPPPSGGPHAWRRRRLPTTEFRTAASTCWWRSTRASFNPSLRCAGPWCTCCPKSGRLPRFSASCAQWLANDKALRDPEGAEVRTVCR